MANELEWSRAYKAQARADMAGARQLAAAPGAHHSVRAMLMQMTLEKLAKSALLASRSISLEKARGSHSAAVPLVAQLATSKQKCRVLQWNQETIRRKVLPLVQELESAQPQRGALQHREAPILEYPWEAPTGEIRWPEEHHPIVKRLRQSRGDGHFLYSFIVQLCERFDEVFPESTP